MRTLSASVCCPVLRGTTGWRFARCCTRTWETRAWATPRCRRTTSAPTSPWPSQPRSPSGYPPLWSVYYHLLVFTLSSYHFPISDLGFDSRVNTNIWICKFCLFGCFLCIICIYLQNEKWNISILSIQFP